MKTLTATVRLHSKQLDFRKSPALFRAFVGGRGAGKSWVGCYDLIRRARKGRTYGVADPTSIMSKDDTFPRFQKIARDLGVWGGCKLTPYPDVYLTTGATIRFRTAEDPEKMRGPDLSGLLLNEASLMPRSAYDIGIACLREGGEQGWLSACFTPRGPSHWTYDVFAQDRPDTFLVRAPTTANPFLPADFAATIRNQYGDTQFARQELEGEFVQLEGAEWSAPLVYLTDAAGKNPRRWFTEWPDPGDVVAKVISLDPSKGISDYLRKPGQRQPDLQAYTILMMDRHGTIYADVDANRESVTEMVTRGIDLADMYGPLDRFAVEDNDGLGMLVTEFRRQMRELVKLVPIVAVRNTVNKIFRLRRLGGYLSNEHTDYGPQLRIKDSAGGRLLVGQLLDFPQGDFDDCVDSLEIGMRQLEELISQVPA